MFKLGKLPPKPHPKTLMLAKYLPSLPMPAAKVYREYKTPDAAKLMFANDTIGDCTCAGIANLLILWTAHTGKVFVPAEQEVIDMYSAITGYVSGDESTDNGAAMTDVLAYMQTTGLAGHKILGWAQIDHTNSVHRNLALQLFGATYVGVQLPKSAQDQFDKKQPWEVVDGDPIAGGHAIVRCGYGRKGSNYVSWAKWDQKASSAWESTYVEEEYAVISPEWIDQVTERTPGGLDLNALIADLAALKW